MLPNDLHRWPNVIIDGVCAPKWGAMKEERRNPWNCHESLERDFGWPKLFFSFLASPLSISWWTLCCLNKAIKFQTSPVVPSGKEKSPSNEELLRFFENLLLVPNSWPKNFLPGSRLGNFASFQNLLFHILSSELFSNNLITFVFSD